MDDNLAETFEPLQLKNGMSIDPKDGSVMGEDFDDPESDYETPEEFIEVPTNQEAVRQITAVNKTITDLPDIPKNMNSIAVVMCYTLFGLSDMNIGIATGLTLEQIANVKMSDTYASYNDEIVTSIVKQEQDNVRNLFAEHSKTAVKKVVKLIRHKNPGIALAASKDVLDRAGHRPADVVEHRLTMDDSIKIVRIIKDETKTNELPPIELTKE